MISPHKSTVNVLAKHNIFFDQIFSQNFMCTIDCLFVILRYICFKRSESGLTENRSPGGRKGNILNFH